MFQPVLVSAFVIQLGLNRCPTGIEPPTVLSYAAILLGPLLIHLTRRRPIANMLPCKFIRRESYDEYPGNFVHRVFSVQALLFPAVHGVQPGEGTRPHGGSVRCVQTPD